MKESINISVWGFDLSVDYYYTPAYCGSLEEPPESEYLEINSIKFLDTPGNLQAMASSGLDEDELQNSKVFLEAVEDAVWDNMYLFEEDDYDADSYIYDFEPEIEW